MDPEFRPKIRWPIDIQQHDHQGQPILVFRCPIGYSSQPLVLNGLVAPVLATFDGRNSLAQIATQLAHLGVTLELVSELVRLLDQNLFLESTRFEKESEAIRGDFASQEARSPALAGLGYSSISSALVSELGAMLQKGESIHLPLQGGLLGLVSPHIDYRRGEMGYGEAYASLRNEVHTHYLVLGTAHQYSPHLFHLTNKHFETPLGTLKNDTVFVQALASRYGTERSLRDEFLHKQEHSIELQTPFLSLLKPEALYIPILVGSFHEFLQRGMLPEQDERYDQFVSSLVEIIQRRTQDGERIGIIAGVDMAHLGKRFGDSEPLSAETMEECERRDRMYLETILRQNKKRLFDHIAEDDDRRRICGFPTMYTVIDVYDRLGINYQGKLFGYHQAIDYATECAVTFAAVGLYADPLS